MRFSPHCREWGFQRKYNEMTYASASDVALHCPEVVTSGCNFSDTSHPTLTQVERFLDMGYSRINARLAARGHGTPVGATAAVYDELVGLEALYAGARVQMARMSSRLGPRERAKGEVLMERFDKELDRLMGLDLSRAGVGVVSAGKLYAGGISKADKTGYEDDTDRVAPRFKREQFAHASRQAPMGSAIDEESE